MDFSRIKAVVADMDGVLWRQDMALPGFLEFFDLMQQRNLPYVLATNNSSKSQADYQAKLARMGVVGVPASAILSSGIATAAFLRHEYPPGTRVHVLGGDGLHDVIREAGFALVADAADVVVAGLDWNLSYDRLKQAALNIRAGAHFIGTNPDTTFPTPEGLYPGAGSILAALQAATGIQPEIIGKPHPPMFEAALRLLRTAPAETLMIGDRLNTDIAGAAALGMRTALVLTGVSTRDDLADADPAPDAVYENLAAVVRDLDESA